PVTKNWETLIGEATKNWTEQPIKAETFLKAWKDEGSSASNAVTLVCADGQLYVAKGLQAGRMIVNDQIAARLGSLIGAATPPPALIDIPAELTAAEQKMKDITPGLAHGLREIPSCTNRALIDNVAK